MEAFSIPSFGILLSLPSGRRAKPRSCVSLNALTRLVVSDATVKEEIGHLLGNRGNRRVEVSVRVRLSSVVSCWPGHRLQSCRGAKRLASVGRPGATTRGYSGPKSLVDCYSRLGHSPIIFSVVNRFPHTSWQNSGETRRGNR